MKRFVFILSVFVVVLYISTPMLAETRLLIRCDDIGMCHTVNMAAKKLIEKGVVFSASVMFACPWYQEAVDILKAHPEAGVGIHLTLNSEWKYYKWGPVLGKEAVPSLVDKDGYFGEHYLSLWDVSPDKKLSTLLKMLDQLEPEKLNLIVIHLGMENPEMQALIDMNNPDDPDRVSQHRRAELTALLSRAFRKAIKKRKIKLITYEDVASEMGVKAMKKPL